VVFVFSGGNLLLINVPVFPIVNRRLNICW